jgi:allantoinase
MTNPMIPRERCDYSAIVDRPPLKLPGNARLVFWTIVNLEVWDISKPMARQVLAPPTGQTMLPDVPNWSWHEYGMRVGVWRFFELYKRLGIRPTLAINARVCEDYRRVGEEAKRDGWEFMGHSYESERGDRTLARRDRAFHRQTAGRLARTRLDRNTGHARPARRGRSQIYRRLGL